MTIKSTLITNIFNEEYLLPFWLTHHKNVFDELIVIDYNSTDKSVDICIKIWPECKIIKTRNRYYEAVEIDREFMDIENTLDGIKMVLNTTEFLFCENSIKELFKDELTPISFDVIVLSPYSKNNYIINTNHELFNNLFNDDVVFHCDRWTRQIHSFSNGNYTIGRHSTSNICTPTNKAYIIWMGFYPMNELLMKRKLQIKQNIPQGDVEKGYGIQHLFSKDKILNVMNEKSDTGISLKNINLKFHNLLLNKLEEGI